MSEVMRAMGDDEPLMIAWKAYQADPDYKRTLDWSESVVITTREIDGELPVLQIRHPYTAGSLWGAFMAGWKAAAKKICEHSDSVVNRSGFRTCSQCGEQL